MQTKQLLSLKKLLVAKFDETIEAHIRTGCDGRHADQQIRGAVVLPHGTGKTVRVLVFAKNAKADEAQAAGADFVGAEELIPKIQNEGWLRFRRSCSYSGYDGRCWSSGPCTWTEGLNAKPEGWYRNHGRNQRLSTISKLVRLSTDLIRPILSTCQLEKLPSPRSS